MQFSGSPTMARGMVCHVRAIRTLTLLPYTPTYLRRGGGRGGGGGGVLLFPTRLAGRFVIGSTTATAGTLTPSHAPIAHQPPRDYHVKSSGRRGTER